MKSGIVQLITRDNLVIGHIRQVLQSTLDQIGGELNWSAKKEKYVRPGRREQI